MLLACRALRESASVAMAQQAASRQPFSRNAMALGPPKKQALPKYPPELDSKVRREQRSAAPCRQP